MPKVKRLTKVVHPNSRKALELASKEHHKSRTQRSKDDTKNKTNVLLKKLTWFKNAVTAQNGEEKMESINENVTDENSVKENDLKTKVLFTNQDVHSLLNVYFHRYDEEIEQIKTKNSIGKRAIGQHFSREKAIEMTLQSEINEYETCGIIMPDMSTPDLVKKFRKWDGEATTIPTLKLKSFKKCFV